MRFAATVVVAACLAIASGAQATVVVKTSLEEMTLRSEVVMQAVVVEQKVVEDKPGKIVTLTTLRVVDGISGVKTGDVVTVYQIGGRLGDTAAWIPGAHHFKQGEEIVFFGVKLAKRPGHVVPWAIGYGLFDILDDVDGRHVHEVVGDVVAAERTAAGETKMVGLEPRRFDSLDAFKADLRAILDGSDRAAPRATLVRPVRQ